MEITKEQYEKIEYCFPKHRKPARISNLEALNAIMYALENGCKWRRLPEKYGDWHVVYVRMNRWAKSGVLENVFLALQKEDIIRINVSVVCLDSTSVKVHPDGMGVLKNTENRRLEEAEAAGTQRFIWSPHLTVML